MTCRSTPAALRPSYVYLACFTPVHWPTCCSSFFRRKTLVVCICCPLLWTASAMCGLQQAICRLFLALVLQSCKLATAITVNRRDGLVDSGVCPIIVSHVKRYGALHFSGPFCLWWLSPPQRIALIVCLPPGWAGVYLPIHNTPFHRSDGLVPPWGASSRAAKEVVASFLASLG